MMNRGYLLLFIITSYLLQSCQLSCSIGNKKGAIAEEIKGPRLFNNIILQAKEIEVEKAFLIYLNGKFVPDDNKIDFSQPVKLVLKINKGWKEHEGKVLLGASEKIEVETGQILLDEKDLFEKGYPDGMSPGDSKIIALTAEIMARKEIPANTAFTISFRIWDKKSARYILGSYTLYAK